MTHRILFCLFVLAHLCALTLGITRVKVSSARAFVKVFESSPVPDEIILENDLDFSHVTLEFQLGGNADACSPFGGVLDGNGHSVKELFMENESSPSVGLFCGLKNATIKNLVIDESCSFAGRVACALSPFVTGNVSVINVTNRASVTGGECAGGFFGSVSGLEHSTVSFDDCVNI